MPKKSALMHLKLPQKEQFKNTAEATGDFVGKKIADKIINVSRSLSENGLETGTNKAENIILNTKTLQKRHISQETDNYLWDKNNMIT